MGVNKIPWYPRYRIPDNGYWIFANITNIDNNIPYIDNNILDPSSGIRYPVSGIRYLGYLGYSILGTPPPWTYTASPTKGDEHGSDVNSHLRSAHSAFGEDEPRCVRGFHTH